jgi:hypothetical protein
MLPRQGAAQANRQRINDWLHVVAGESPDSTNILGCGSFTGIMLNCIQHGGSKATDVDLRSTRPANIRRKVSEPKKNPTRGIFGYLQVIFRKTYQCVVAYLRWIPM